MAINKKNTNLLKERFKEIFEQEPEVYDEDQYGCAAIVITTDETIHLRDLNNLTEGIGNSLTIRVDDEGRLRVAVW